MKKYPKALGGVGKLQRQNLKGETAWGEIFSISQFYREHGFPWWPRQERICLQCRSPGFDPWVGKIHWRREQLPTAVFLPGELHGQRSLAGYSPRGHKESDVTEQLSLSLLIQSRLQSVIRGVKSFPKLASIVLF